MDPAISGEVTRLLGRIGDGDARASQDLYSMVYEELRSLGHRYMRHENDPHTLQTTALVNEAFLRLVPKDAIRWGDREHFFQVAAGTMRAVLVDHARRRKAAKRSADGQRVELDAVLESYEQSNVDVLAVDETLRRLADVDEQLARIVELRFFAGLTIAETAGILGVSTNTVDRGWHTARAWMKIELGN